MLIFGCLIVFTQMRSLISEKNITTLFSQNLRTRSSTQETTTTGDAYNTSGTSTDNFATGIHLLSSRHYSRHNHQQQQQQRQQQAPNWMMAVDCTSFDQSCTTYHVKQKRYAPYPFDIQNVNATIIPQITAASIDSNQQPKWLTKPVQPAPLKYNLQAALNQSEPYSLNRLPHTVPSDVYQHCVHTRLVYNYSWQLDQLLPAPRENDGDKSNTSSSSSSRSSSTTNQTKLETNPNFYDTVVLTIGDFKYTHDMMHSFFQMSYDMVTNQTRSVFLVALDEPTMEMACSHGYPVILLPTSKDAQQQIQNSKFLLSRDMVDRGFNYIFYEMDIWWIQPPLPSMQELIHHELVHQKPMPDILVSGHQDNPAAHNIGFYIVFANERTREFFRELFRILETCPTIFDQFAFGEMLRISLPYVREPPGQFSHKKFAEQCSNSNTSRIPTVPKLRHKTQNNQVLPGFQAQPWPLVHENTLAIHPLCDAPLRSPNGKKMIAKELGAWYGYQSPSSMDVSAVGNDHTANPELAGYYQRTGPQYRRYLMLDGRAWMGYDFNERVGPDIGFYHNNQVFTWTVALLVAVARQTSRILILPKVFHDRLGNFVWTGLDLETLEGIVEFRETNFINHPQAWYRDDQPFASVARTALGSSTYNSQELKLFGQPKDSSRIEMWRFDRNVEDSLGLQAVDLWFEFMTSCGYDDAELLLINPHFLHNEPLHRWKRTKRDSEKSPLMREVIELNWEVLKWCWSDRPGDIWAKFSQVWPPGRARAQDDCYGIGQLLPH